MIPFLLAGCALARIDSEPHQGYAYVTIPSLPDGKLAVQVYGINSEHRFHTQPVKEVHSFSVKAGTYLLDVDCMRPGAGYLVDGSFDFVVSVEADKHYVLDCAPEHQPGNGFYIAVGT